MADYSTIVSNLQTALNTAAEGGLIEGYASSEGNSARLGKGVDQLAAMLRAEGVNERRSSGGLFRIGRKVNPFC